MEKRDYLASMDLIVNDDIIISQYICNNDYNELLETADEINFNDNECFKIQRIGMTILTGDEDWFYDEEEQAYYYYQFNKFCNEITGNFDKMLCTHFRWIKGTSKLNYGEFKGSSDNKIMFMFHKEKDENGNILKFKQWLKEQFDKGIAVKVFYILQYPEISYLSHDFIPEPRFIPHHHEIIIGKQEEKKVTEKCFLEFEALIK